MCEEINRLREIERILEKDVDSPEADLLYPEYLFLKKVVAQKCKQKHQML